MSKWVSTAGPRQIKDINKAIRAISWEGHTSTTLTGIVGVTEGYSREGSHQSTALGGDARPETAAIQAQIGEKWNWSITRENARAILADLQAGLEELKTSRPVCDERRTQDQDAARKTEAQQREAARQAEAAIENAQNAALTQKWRREFPDLEQSEGSTKTRWARGSANIRTELNRAFPGISFTVRSNSYSGGCSIDIGWYDGPTEKDVKAVSDKYQTSRFDGRDDSTHSTSTHWNAVYGGASYVSENRDISEATRAALTPWAEDCIARGERFGAHDAGTLIHQLVYDTTLPAGAVVQGAARREGDCSGINRPSTVYKIVFTVPDPVPAFHEPTQQQGTGVIVSQNEEQDGVEVHFPSKPDAATLATMKANRFRWSRHSGCWYHKRTPEAMRFAFGMVGQAPQLYSDGGDFDPMGVDRAYEDQCAALAGV